MIYLSRTIDVDLNLGFMLMICWWRYIERINSIMWTGEFTICCIEGVSDIVFNIFPNNWIDPN